MESYESVTSPSAGRATEHTIHSDSRPESDAQPATRGGPGHVLIVGNTFSLAHLYATWLSDRWQVKVAPSCRAALEQLDRRTFDVVLVDAKTLEDAACSPFEHASVGAQGTQTVLVDTDPSTDIHADDYVLRPTERSALRGVVETATGIARYDAAIAELVTLVTRRRRLCARHTSSGTEQSSEIRDVTSRICKLTSQIEDDLLYVEAQYAELVDRGPRKIQAANTEAATR